MGYRYEDEIEEERMRRRRKKREEMRRRKKKQLLIRKLILIGLPILAVVIIGIVVFCVIHQNKKNEKDTVSDAMVSANRVQQVISVNHTESENQVSENETVSENTPQVDTTVYSAVETPQTSSLPGEVVSTYGILVDANQGQILAQRDAKTRISPASMTKILTVLVAAEHVTNLDDTVTITTEETDFSYVNDCSNVGFADGETVTIRDLFYGTILPSGADAAVALADYVAGSQEAFVELMNRKLDSLGLSGSAHFTNCVGLYDENHYCTAYDMAMILEAAVHNDICREVMSAHTYTTSITTEHPEGITISNWFLRRIEDKENGNLVLCAKTGYVVQSGNCSASYAVGPAGEEYICVTVNATSAWRCIYDHVAVYQQVFKTG